MGLWAGSVKNIEKLDDSMIFLLEKVDFDLQLSNKIAFFLKRPVAMRQLLLQLVLSISELFSYIRKFLIMKSTDARQFFIDNFELFLSIAQTLR